MRAVCLVVLVSALVWLAGCAAAPSEPEPVLEAPPVVESQPSAPQALPGLDGKARFREVLMQLEAGNVDQARVELEVYLDEYPGSEVGADLMRQIDEPIDAYYPANYRDIKLQSGQSLSTLAKHYLGSVYQFHALARYNGIAEARSLKAGQALRIPLTDYAQAVFQSEDNPAQVNTRDLLDMPKPSATEAVVEEEVMIVDAVAGEPVERDPVESVGSGTATTDTEQAGSESGAAALAPAGDPEALHRQALSAYRAQDLEGAIELWDQVLAIDPEHESARLYRTQAVELQKKLRNLN